MTCTEAREALLEAEPAELGGAGTSAVALHLAGCSECAVRARAILAGMQAMDAALVGLASAPVPRSRRRAPAVRWVALGLAAAAVLAGVLLVRREPGTSLAVPIATAPPLPRGVEVDLAAAPRSAAVFATADSTITVVWYF